MLWLNRKGFTLVEIMIVVAIIGLLAVIAIPNFIKARDTARKNLCINNLRLIDSAKEQWAVDNNADDGNSSCTSAIVSEYIRDGFPSCPGDGAYTVDNIGADPTCNITGHTL